MKTINLDIQVQITTEAIALLRIFTYIPVKVVRLIQK